MGKDKEIEKEEGGPWFNERIKRAHKALRSRNWRKFKKIFEEDKTALLDNFDLFGNTAIGIAPRSRNPKFLKDLLQLVPEEARWDALTKKNREGNTLLHEIALEEEVKMVDVVRDFATKAAAPPEVEEEEKVLRLLEIENLGGETPLFRAAKCGKLKMLNHMANILQEAARDMKIHLHANRQANILHVCVLGQFFDVAVWVMMRMEGTVLASEENKKGHTPLQLLSRMPRTFRSHRSIGCWEKLFYYLLPEEVYAIDGYDSSESFRKNSDLEIGQQDNTRPQTSDLSTINYAFWKYLAKVLNKIDTLWKEKNELKLAERLAELLVKKDYSWQKYYTYDKYGMRIIQLPPVLYNVPQRKIEIELKEKWQEKKKALEDGHGNHLDPYYSYTPLLIAASNGITEIVELYLQEHPTSINLINEDGENILHIAVKHRHLEIFKLLKKHPEFGALTPQLDKHNRSILHQVARRDYYRAPDLAGAAFQLQSELKWYKRVEKVIPKCYIMHCDERDVTAGDLLDIEHDDMLRDAQSWAKETAQSCSTVSILVATVVFAAAYTIPAENEAGAPAFLRSPVFIFFTVMDVVALALS